MGEARHRRSALARWWPLAAIGGVMLAFYLSGAAQYASLSSLIREHAELVALVRDNPLLSGAAYVLVYAAAVAASFPGASLLTIIGGALFGAVPGTALTVVAATAGASAIFAVARSTIGEALRQRAKGVAARFADGLERDAFAYLVLLRLVPVVPFWLANVVPALFRMPLRTYVAATALGIVPGTLAYSLLGDGFTGFVATLEQRQPGCVEAGTCTVTLSALASPGPLIALAALSAAAAIPLVVRRLRGRPA